jgi:protein-S-isoprenylcysteine O-methyltransferase Ste14
VSEGERDGASVRVPPPLVYLGAVIAGAAIHRLGWPLPLGLPSGARIVLTAVAAVLGILSIGGAIRLFRRTGQDPTPWEPTPEIVSTGIYRFTRNPMYVGMALLQIAIGVGLANGWILALVPVSLVLVYWTAVRHEEAYLARKFGETYASYKRSVRRWL